ncbi:hypothetical protein D1007_04730 [Hordeum vulgare]|nr:hypothetical protein D1007_04730 [Hordeum vulgare]
MEKFEDILSKKEEAYIKRTDIKEEKNTERFKLLMEATEKKRVMEEKRALIEEESHTRGKKVKLKEKKVKIATDAEDAKDFILVGGFFGCRRKNDRASHPLQNVTPTT